MKSDHIWKKSRKNIQPTKKWIAGEICGKENISIHKIQSPEWHKKQRKDEQDSERWYSEVCFF